MIYKFPRSRKGSQRVGFCDPSCLHRRSYSKGGRKTQKSILPYSSGSWQLDLQRRDETANLMAFDLLRGLVSQSKRRYRKNGFDLDMSFIDCLPHIQGKLLAMSYPAEGKEAWYRNSCKDVRRFLEHHRSKGKGDYKVYNLTAERPSYSAERLGGELANFTFEDHQVPSLLQMQDFCKDLDAFLSQNPDNFAAVHCKAGKGRTGVMICAYLLHKNLAANAMDAMDIYARQRSKILAGLTVPSQRRYVAYYGAVIAEQQMLAPVALSLESVSISGLPRRLLANLTVCVTCRSPSSGDMIPAATMQASEGQVSLQGGTRYTSASPRVQMQPPPATAFSSQPGVCEVEGDVRLEVYDGQPKPKTLLFRTWFNTSFVSPGSYSLTSDELDKGAAAVKPGTTLTLQLAQPVPTATAGLQAGGSGSLFTPLHELESLPSSLSCETARSEVDGGSPAPPQSAPQQSQKSVQPHILEIHPDFSIPARFPLPPAEQNSLAPRPPTPAATQQLPSSPSLSSCSCGTSMQELNDRLESLAQAGSLPTALRKLDTSRRSQSVPVSWTGAPFDDSIVPIPRTLGLVRLKPVKSQYWYDDPEMHDLSAPTTPSLPRPPTSIDWQRGTTTAPAAQASGAAGDATWFSSFAPGSQQPAPPFAPFQEGTASGADSPSHGAQMIKWMSSSWWLAMA